MQRLDIELPQNSYPIYIENNLIDNIGEKIREIYKGKKVAVITDENVNKYYGQLVEDNLKKSDYEVKKIVLKPGEKTKSIKELINLYDSLLDFGITRGDLIVTLGGGVIGDLGGFAAATLLRGISFIQVPTSLLAQIDSSIGGKVAVDLPRGKNLVGNFYHPKAVFIDPKLLKTLDKRFLYDGMAEVIKYGAIRDKKLFDVLSKLEDEEDLFNNIEYIIYTCCNIKKKVVENDEKDTGERMILNYGHTIGHAVEKYFNFEKYTHGEAVAIGMYLITKKSEELGITKKGTSDVIKEILIKYNLPYKEDMLQTEAVLKTISVDKKSKGDYISLILLQEIGNVLIKKVHKKEVQNFI